MTGADTGARSSKEAILEASEYLFASRGYSGTSIAQICERSGLPNGSVYHHFGSKLGLLDAVLEAGSDRLDERLTVAATASPEYDLEHFFDVAADVLLEEMRYLRVSLMISLEAIDNDELRTVLGKQGTKAQQILDQAIGRYIESRGVPDATAFTPHVAAMVLALARGGIVDMPFSTARFRATLADCITVIKALVDERLSHTAVRGLHKASPQARDRKTRRAVRR